jgi:hypothetical protein
MRWIASRTTISLFGYLVIHELKSKLKQQRASQVTFPPGKQEGRIEGIIFLAGLIALLFVPLMIMSSSETASMINPISVATASFGISGLPTFYDNQVVPFTLSDENRKQFNLSGLTRFLQSPSEQIQVIDLPFGSMLQWTVSSDAIAASKVLLNDSKSTVIPYGSFALVMSNATTSNRVQTVTKETHGENLDATSRKSIELALNGTATSLFIPGFLPMFLTIGYDQTPNWIPNYTYKVEFRYVTNGNETGAFWQMRSQPENPETPKYITDCVNCSRILVWSEKVPDAITGTVLASTGGILGLYSFVLLTIGQWISSWVKNLFTELWLSRMVNPQKLLNIVLALEAYELSGESDKEFELSELLLENLRFTGRVVQMTNAIDPEA